MKPQWRNERHQRHRRRGISRQLIAAASHQHGVNRGDIAAKSGHRNLARQQHQPSAGIEIIHTMESERKMATKITAANKISMAGNEIKQKK